MTHLPQDTIYERYIEAFFEESEDGEPPAFQVSLVGKANDINKAIAVIEAAGYEIVQYLEPSKAPAR